MAIAHELHADRVAAHGLHAAKVLACGQSGRVLAQLTLPSSAGLGVLEDAARGVRADVLAYTRSPHQVDVQDASHTRDIAGAFGHDFVGRFLMVHRVAVVVELDLALGE